MESKKPLIRLTDSTTAFGVLNRVSDFGAAAFGDDNGGDPDGPDYLLPEEELAEDELNALLNAQVAERVEGVALDNYDGSDAQRELLTIARSWCGFSSRNVVYVAGEPGEFPLEMDVWLVLDTTAHGRRFWTLNDGSRVPGAIVLGPATVGPFGDGYPNADEAAHAIADWHGIALDEPDTWPLEAD